MARSRVVRISVMRPELLLGRPRLDRLAKRPLQRGRVDVAQALHPAQDLLLASLDAGEVAVRIEHRRGPRHGGQEGRLGQAQSGGRLVEVLPRGGFDAEGLVAVGDAVEVLEEDALFRQTVVEPDRQPGFADLGGQGAAEAPDVADHLLGDGRGARDNPPAAQVLDEGPGHRGEVDPGVGEEGLVLGSHRGSEQLRRDVGQPDPAAAPALVR
jgi:hypothetical protein